MKTTLLILGSLQEKEKSSGEGIKTVDMSSIRSEVRTSSLLVGHYCLVERMWFCICHVDGVGHMGGEKRRSWEDFASWAGVGAVRVHAL